MSESKDVSYLISLRDQFSSKLGGIQKQAASFDKQMSGVGNTMKDFAGMFAGAFAIGGAISFLNSSAEAWDKVELAVSRVNTALASTKGAAGLSSNEIEKQAKNLSKGILQGKAEIMDAQGMLLSFTGIKGPIFEQTTKAVADFATFYKTDMTTAALAIGKAMNNPAEGMTKLQRQGVTFTAEQQKQIKHLQAQGKIMEAQAVILKELNTEFGGQAEAAFKTDDAAAAKKAFNNVKVTIGELIDTIQGKLAPLYNYLGSLFNKVSDYIKKHANQIMALGKFILSTVAAFGIFKLVMLGIKGAMQLATIATNLYRIANVIMTRGLSSAITMIGSFKAALVSTGIGILIVGIGILISKLAQWKIKTDEQNEKQKELNKTLQGTRDYIEDINWQLGKTQYGNFLKSIGAIKTVTGKGGQQILNFDSSMEIMKKFKESMGNWNEEQLQNFQKYFSELVLDATRTLDQTKGAMEKNILKQNIKEWQKGLNLVNKELERIQKLRGQAAGVTTGDNITKIESAAPKVFNINIQKLVDTFTVTTASIKEGSADIKQKVLETLLGALNDVQITANI